MKYDDENVNRLEKETNEKEDAEKERARGERDKRRMLRKRK